MSDRDSSQAQHDALRAARAQSAGDRRRAHEDALTRYLRLNARRPARQRTERPEPPPATTEATDTKATDTETESE